MLEDFRKKKSMLIEFHRGIIDDQAKPCLVTFASDCFLLS